MVNGGGGRRRIDRGGVRWFPRGEGGGVEVQGGLTDDCLSVIEGLGLDDRILFCVARCDSQSFTSISVPFSVISLMMARGL